MKSPLTTSDLRRVMLGNCDFWQCMMRLLASQGDGPKDGSVVLDPSLVETLTCDLGRLQELLGDDRWGKNPPSAQDMVVSMAHDVFMREQYRKLIEVQQAMRVYHSALTQRMHGGVAAGEAIRKIEDVLEINWLGP